MRGVVSAASFDDDVVAACGLLEMDVEAEVEVEVDGDAAEVGENSGGFLGPDLGLGPLLGEVLVESFPFPPPPSPDPEEDPYAILFNPFDPGPVPVIATEEAPNEIIL